ncbi:hypothetical protein V5O48_015716 [Marasmius crinis-equi]|uniref:Uncharacterized protein n=1 Tax=Marasmius crinis-equi TaxID=585013 RepID=A0ABR3ETQ9_9AGAR
MSKVPTDPEKVQRMKKRMAKECAAQASQKYRERSVTRFCTPPIPFIKHSRTLSHRKEYNEKARLRMANNRQALSEEQVQKRKEKARQRYERNRYDILEKAKKKRIQQYIEREGTTGFQDGYRPRHTVPSHLLDLKRKDPAKFDTEKFMWKKRLLTEQYLARKSKNPGRKWY